METEIVFATTTTTTQVSCKVFFVVDDDFPTAKTISVSVHGPNPGVVNNVQTETETTHVF